MPTTDPNGDADLLARIHDWLLTLWTNPEAAAQFAENPAVSLASNNLSQDSLNSANLRHIAGDVAGTPGLPAGGQHVLNSFAHSPSSSGGVREVFHVTREVHHDNPIIQKIFQDNSVHIDNSQTFVNNGIVDGNISLDNNSATAIGHGAVAGAGGATVNAATGDGSVANHGEGDVNQASGHGQIIDGSDVGQNSANSPGSAQVGGNSDGAVNTGVVHGTQAGGGATGNVTGDHNDTATVGSSSGGTDGSHDGQPDGSHDGSHGGPTNIPETGGPGVHQGDGSHDGQPPADPTHGDSSTIPFGQGAPTTPAPTGGPGTGDPSHHDGGGEPVRSHVADVPQQVATNTTPVEDHSQDVTLPHDQHVDDHLMTVIVLESCM